MSDELRAVLRKLAGALSGQDARHLTRWEAEEAFAALLAGAGTDAQVASLFTAVRARGATADELAGCAAAARLRIEFPVIPERGVVLSSTRLGKSKCPPLALASALAASAVGVPILMQCAPHAQGAGVTVGDIWHRLVGPLSGDRDATERLLSLVGVAGWRPAAADDGWQRMLRIEDELGLRSLPDIIFKLLLPDGARVCVPSRRGPVLGIAASALEQLGHRRAVVLQGVEGSLDPSVTAQTRGMRLSGDRKFPVRVNPDDLALAWECEPSQEHENRLEAAVAATMQALAAVDGPAMRAVVLGGGLLVELSGLVPDLATGAAEVRDALESGRAHRRLDELREAIG
ncbi:MAG: hypothetical protein HOM34_00735 [Planctomycetes bacterium]|jgi:anthranilate phosphoribosyltransferase|nr:hypothetical protein [Planctomycetota bacterium]MBT4560014.1 hypothetical protein [Planctomycetota bacterium]MBT5100771.1 hypothetical protein [Planctomycetota bacterium]MBT5119230.1 hypothetical protein [Planctomycetota bacterium]MBT7318588.1 hypothetical protein [Planctomycetota bacterium]